MIWIAYIAGGLAGLLGLMALIGLGLPRGHVAARGAVLPAPTEAVWRALVDLDAQPRWRRGLKQLERLGERRFRETTSHGAITFEVVEERPPELRITRIADEALPFGGRWIYELASEGGGTRLTITEDGFIKNPVFRLLARTVFPTTATMEAFLRDLGAHLRGAPTVEPAAPSPRARGQA
jgi:uncharacterized protein YndB with AHSA1/START domain